MTTPTWHKHVALDAERLDTRQPTLSPPEEPLRGPRLLVLALAWAIVLIVAAASAFRGQHV